MPQLFSPAETSGRVSCNWLDWGSLVQNAREPVAAAWSTPEAFFCVLFSAAGCDGPIAREEQEELLALVHRSRALKTLSEEALYRVIGSVIERMRVDGDRALAEACAALLPEARPSAFAHALDIVLSDGDLSEDESKFLNDLVSLLGLDEQAVRSIADVIILKNRY